MDSDRISFEMFVGQSTIVVRLLVSIVQVGDRGRRCQAQRGKLLECCLLDAHGAAAANLGAARQWSPTPEVADNFVTALVDARQWLAGRAFNADKPFQSNAGREAQGLPSPLPVQLSAGQSAAEPSFSL